VLLWDPSAFCSSLIPVPGVVITVIVPESRRRNAPHALSGNPFSQKGTGLQIAGVGMIVLGLHVYLFGTGLNWEILDRNALNFQIDTTEKSH